MHVPSRQRCFPQTPSDLDDFIYKDNMEGDNITIFPQRLPRWTFYDFYYHHICLDQMRRLAVRSSATPGLLGNWWTCLHFHEGHGSISLRCFFCIFHHPLSRSLQCARLNIITQCAIIPDSSIIVSNFPKREGKGPHRTLLFSKTSLIDLLMVSKESPI